MGWDGGVAGGSNLGLRDPHPPQANFTARLPPPSKPGNPILRPGPLRPLLPDPTGLPSRGLPVCTTEGIRGFRSSWKVQGRTRGGWAAERRVGHLKSRTGSLGPPGSTPSPPGRLGRTGEAGRPAREPWPRWGRGAAGR